MDNVALLPWHFDPYIKLECFISTDNFNLSFWSVIRCQSCCSDLGLVWSSPPRTGSAGLTGFAEFAPGLAVGYDVFSQLHEAGLHGLEEVKDDGELVGDVDKARRQSHFLGR